MEKSVPKLKKPIKKLRYEYILDKIFMTFIVFILPILSVVLLYYFRKYYKKFPITYIIFLILTILYFVWNLLFIFVLSRIR